MKTILITGGSSGIGKATALMFAQNGADIAFTYKSNMTKVKARDITGQNFQITAHE